MIYAIGHTESYTKYFAEQGTPKKKGRGDDYEGGSVWQTREEAQANCPDDYSVYGVLADWDKDTARAIDCWEDEKFPWRVLIVDSDLVMLPIEIDIPVL